MSTGSATQPLESDQADHSYYSHSPEKTPGEDDETGRSSADSDQSYLTPSTGIATEDPVKGNIPSLPTEYSFGTDVEREASTRESQPVSGSALTHATKKRLLGAKRSREADPSSWKTRLPSRPDLRVRSVIIIT